MKTIIYTVVVLGAILGGIVLYEPKAIEYVSPQVVEKEVVKEVNPLDEQIKQREKELDEKYSKIKSLEARRDVLKAEREKLDAEIAQITKDLAGFMTGTQ